jgi:hypothetical protein
MDPVTLFGAAASAMAFAEMAGTIARTMLVVYRRYKDGPEDMRRVFMEAGATESVLRNLGTLLRDPVTSSVEEFISEALERCRGSLQDLKTVLHRIDKSPGSRRERLLQALKDVFWEHQAKIQTALDTLARVRAELALAFIGGV